MDPAAGNDKPVPRWGSRHTVDAVVALITLLVGVVMMVDSWKTGAGWDDGRLQSGYFPFRLGAIIVMVSVAIFGRAVWAGRRERVAFVRWGEFRRVLAVLTATILYALGIQFVGIYVATAVLIAGFMRLASRYGWLATAAVSIATSVTLFVLFEIAFLVPLPKGPLESLLGY